MTEQEPTWMLHIQWESEFSCRTEGIPDWDRILLDVSRENGNLIVRELAITRPTPKQKKLTKKRRTKQNNAPTTS